MISRCCNALNQKGLQNSNETEQKLLDTSGTQEKGTRHDVGEDSDRTKRVERFDLQGWQPLTKRYGTTYMTFASSIIGVLSFSLGMLTVAWVHEVVTPALDQFLSRQVAKKLSPSQRVEN